LLFSRLHFLLTTRLPPHPAQTALDILPSLKEGDSYCIQLDS
jgi:hypothetical protein